MYYCENYNYTIKVFLFGDKSIIECFENNGLSWGLEDPHEHHNLSFAKCQILPDQWGICI